jgi:hypothetical protein
MGDVFYFLSYTFLGRKKQTKLGLIFFSEKNKKANIFGASFLYC